METIQNTSIPSPEYRELPISQLVESITNPRKRYQQSSLEDLAQSFRSRGVLEPLLVRPIEPERFEIVAGSRRYWAARIAELETVPARVREMTDAEALEVQCIENLQREDIHPLEEAQGFRALLELPDQPYNVARIAERAGKPPGYVLGRLKLTELIADIADAFLADNLTIGHALLIAKLPPLQQQEPSKPRSDPPGSAAHRQRCSCRYARSSYAMHSKCRAFLGRRRGDGVRIKLDSALLAAWIESNLLLDLQTATFDRADSSLVPKAGSCCDCLKRTGANSLLFPESPHDACLDGACYQSKVAAHVSVSLGRNPQLIQISSAWGTHSTFLDGAVR